MAWHSTKNQTELWKAVDSKYLSLLQRDNSEDQLEATIIEYDLLYEAVCCKHYFAVAYLIMNGVDANYRMDETCPTFLHWAAFYGHEEIVRLLCSKMSEDDVIASGGTGMATPMHWAAFMGQLDVMHYLFSVNKSSIMQGSDNAALPIHWAAMQGQLEAVKILVDQGSDFLAKDMQGHTPLDLAISGNRHEVIQYLKGVEGDWKRAVFYAEQACVRRPTDGHNLTRDVGCD